MAITITVEQAQVEAALDRLISRLGNFGGAADDIATLLKNSIRRNFVEGGRPDKWRPSKRAESDTGETLRDSDALMNSIVGRGYADMVKVGTNVSYAAAHNFGVDKQVTQTVRSHVRRITKAFGRDIGLKEVTVKEHSRQMHIRLPKREFMLVQDEDWDDIAEILLGRLEQSFSGEN
ncbi:MAG: hypothetical protein CSB24_00745 [Deltaproteobacteria bacterium]|nr:MAG: hypothetical protein CSB24_00745 [Deltaproteobacteria bacterium]